MVAMTLIYAWLLWQRVTVARLDDEGAEHSLERALVERRREGASVA
jgi:hypothetical protein